MEQYLPKDLELLPYAGIPPEIVANFFSLQERIERDIDNGGMDYFRFSRELWGIFFNDAPDIGSPAYKEFEAIVVLGLEKFTTKELLYPEIKTHLNDIIKAIYPVVERMILWSRGDAHHTGYQTSKMVRSGLKNTWLRSLLHFGNDGARELIRDKTSIIIEEEKNSPLERLLDSTKPGSLVVIEDSLKNLETTHELARGRGVPHTGVWAAYSREGARLHGSEKYKEAASRWKVLSSPSELVAYASSPDLQGATLVLDFDGVLGNNTWMRQQQSRVFWTAIAHCSLSKQ